ncbi:hypothetical protein MP228_001320 [Amoeboaphelidium protococcarum]|nr:hypothetical protein MP228_001320 [Amoeboaphelidium protococcarum]
MRIAQNLFQIDWPEMDASRYEKIDQTVVKGVTLSVQKKQGRSVKRKRIHETKEQQLDRLRKACSYQQSKLSTEGAFAHEVRRIKNKVCNANRRAKEISDKLLSPELASLLDRTNGIQPLTQSEQEYVYDQLCKALHEDALKKVVCCCCDCLTDVSDSEEVDIDKAPLQAMAQKLKFPQDPDTVFLENLHVFYDQSALYPQLAGMMLSQKGIQSDLVSGKCSLMFCTLCLNSLRNKSISCPPQYAIANGFYIGQLPDMFNDTTRVEYAMTNRAQSSAYITRVTGGHHQKIKGHSYAFVAKPNVPCELLPRSLSKDQEIKVVICSAMTQAQKAAVMRKWTCRLQRTTDLLNYYRANNHHYKSVQLVPAAPIIDNYNTTVIQFRSVKVNAKSTSSDAEGRHSETVISLEASSGTEADETQEVYTESVVFQEEMDGADDDQFAIFRSTEFLFYKNPLHFYYAFAELFPLGRGGPSESRSNHVSWQQCLLYYMRLSSRHFQTHPTFSLIAAQLLGHDNASRSIIHTVCMNPRHGELGLTVDRAYLERHLLRQQQIRSSMRNNVQPPPMHENGGAVRQMISTVNKGKAKYWGSNEERVHARKQAFSMVNHFGQPHIFLTVSPDSKNIKVVLEHCTDMPTANMQLFNEILGDIQRRHQLVSKNPYVCAEYFDKFMHAMFEQAFQFDLKHQRSKSKPGVFGYTKAAYASIESQGSLNLHAHFMVWIHGLPETVAEYKQLCTDVDFRDRMLAYATQIVTSVPPVPVPSKCQQTTECSDATCNGDFEVQPVPSHAYKRKNGGKPEFACVECTDCGKKYTNSELLDVAIALQAEAAGAEVQSDDQVMQMLIQSEPLPLCMDSTDDPRSKYLLAQALKVFQIHNYTHAKSCFKASVRTKQFNGIVCRFLHPSGVIEVSVISQTGQLQFKVIPGGQYLNPYNRIITCAVKANNDVKLLLGSGTAELIYYTLKYSTKEQLQIEDEFQFALATFDRTMLNQRRRDAEQPDRTDQQRVMSRYLGLFNQQTKPVELGGPMACLYMIHGEPFYWSHRFVNCQLGQAMAHLLRNDTVNLIIPPSMLQTAEDQASAVTRLRHVIQIEDYQHRPIALDSVSYSTFVSEYEKTSGSIEDTGQDVESEQATTVAKLNFKQEHPQFRSHILRRRTQPHVPVVCATRPPNIADQDLSEADQVRYYQHMLILHRPFRSVEHLLMVPDQLHAWKTEFNNWLQSGQVSASAQRYIAQIQSYHDSKTSENTSKLDHKQLMVQQILEQDPDNLTQHFATNHFHDSDGDNDDDDDDPQDHDDEAELAAGFALNQAIRSLTSEQLEQSARTRAQRNIAIDEYPLTQAAINFALSSSVSRPQQCGSQHAPLSYREQCMQLNIPDVVNVKRFVRDINQIDNTDAFVRTLPIQSVDLLDTRQIFGHRETIVRSVIECLQTGTDWQPPNPQSRLRGTIREYSSIKEITIFYTLNERQHISFRQNALSLLKAYTSRFELPTDIFASDSSHANVPLQQLSYLCGGPGYGKSEVIKALLTFAAAWHQVGSVQTCSYMGVAAQLVWGRTNHSKFGLNNSGKPSRNVPNVPALRPLQLLIIDEMSYVPQEMLGAIEIQLQKVFDKNLVMGGKSLLAVLDWNQQKPINNHSLFLDPLDSVDNSKPNMLRQRIRGHNVYRAINTGVFLNVNIRQGQKYPRYVQLVEKYQDYTLTLPEFLEFNDYLWHPHVQDGTDAEDPSKWTSEQLALTPIIVSSNVHRAAFNDRCALGYAKYHQTSIIEWTATVNKGRLVGQCTASEINSLSTLRDDKTGRAPIAMRTCIGMPHQVTHNSNSNLLLSNGTIAYMAHIQHHEQNTFTEYMDDGVLIKRCSHAPVLVWLKLDKINQTLAPDFPPGVVPLFPRSNTVKLALGERVFTLNIEQFPLTHAFSITVEKCQGQSHQQNIIAPLLNKVRGKKVQRCSLIVAITRILEPPYSRLLRPLTAEDYEFFQPEPEVQQEVTRLKQMQLER